MFDKSEEPPQGLHTTILLGEDDITAFLALQKKVADTISADKRHHLKIRDAHDLLTHIGHRMPIIGVKDEDGKLVGQCLLSYPSHGEAVKNIAGYPINDQKCTTAIVQSLAVDPDMRGQKIAEKILDTAKEIALMSGHVLLVAKVAKDNPQSTKTFLGAAFSLASEGLDPVKHYPVNYWQYHLYPVCAATPQCMAK